MQFPLHLTRQQFEAAILWATIQGLERKRFQEQQRRLEQTRKGERERRRTRRWNPVPRTRVAQIISRLLGVPNWQAIDGPLKTILEHREWVELIQQEFSAARFGKEEYRILRHSETIRRANEERQKIAERGEFSGRTPRGYFLPPGSNILQEDPKWGPIVSAFWRELGRGEESHSAAAKVGLVVPRNVLHWITGNHVYRAYEKGSDIGCMQYARKIYKGQHKALVDYTTWEQAQWFRAARRAPHPFGLLWARNYELVISPEEKLTLQNPFPQSKEKLIVDPAEELRLRRICKLRVEHWSTTRIAKELRTRLENVSSVLSDEDYRILGADWRNAHEAAGDLRKVPRAQKDELVALEWLVLHQGVGKAKEIAEGIRKSRSWTFQLLKRLEKKGWIERRRRMWNLTNLEAAKALLKAGIEEVPPTRSQLKMHDRAEAPLVVRQ